MLAIRSARSVNSKLIWTMIRIGFTSWRNFDYGYGNNFYGFESMALVPCKECGTLNSENAEICLSCEFPIKGRSQKQLWRWVAFGLALMLGAPVALYALDLIKARQSTPIQKTGFSKQLLRS